MKVTIQKIAELCGVSIMTVSRVFDPEKAGMVKESTRKKVLAVAKQYNYHPSIGYNIMTGRTTNIIAVVFSQKRVTQHDMLQKSYMALCIRLNEEKYAISAFCSAVIKLMFDTSESNSVERLNHPKTRVSTATKQISHFFLSI